MDTSELLKKVRRIEIKTRGLSKHIFSGEYHSAFKGRGMSFSEVREYQYGDDVRNIDWNVTARTGEPHVKIFEEERELTVMLLVDVSRSVFFGTHTQFKEELATEICAVLAFSAIHNNDKVGVLFFSDRVERFIPPRKGRQHILRIIRELLAFEPRGHATDIGQALRYFNNLVKKRSICFLLSDFLSEGYAEALRIVGRKHDLVGIHLYDPLELKLSHAGLWRVEDAESGRTGWLDTFAPQVRHAWTSWFHRQHEACRHAFRRAASDLIAIRTDESYVRALIRFFQKRVGHAA